MKPNHFGYETVVNPDVATLSGGFRVFIEISSFILFALGVILNTGFLTFMITAYPNLDSFDALLINLSFGELVASFGLAFVFFVEFTSSLAPIGDSGCRFIQWLNVTSITITATALLALVYELHWRIYNGSITKSLPRIQTVKAIILPWFVASLFGAPYFFTGKMSDNHYCSNQMWSNDAEIFHISVLFILQIILPLIILIFAFVRIFIALRSPRDGDMELVDETAPGSEASLQRGIFKCKALLVAYIAMFFYMILIVFTIISLALALNVDNIEANISKYARIREINSLFECFICVIVPVFCFMNYDKVKMQVRKHCCCFRTSNQELYNTLNLRYSVYQQTVQESENMDIHHSDAVMQDELYETERDDVAIINNSS